MYLRLCLTSFKCVPCVLEDFGTLSVPWALKKVEFCYLIIA